MQPTPQSKPHHPQQRQVQKPQHRPSNGSQHGAEPHPLLRALDTLPTPFAVGFSGGSDSSALLVACAQRWPGQVEAVHVHHGLQVAADGFESHCRRFCEVLGIPISVKRVDARAQLGESPENAARIARYHAFGHFVQQPRHLFAIKSIALGHHADDQLESILLALSRGSGLPGLSGMASRFEKGGAHFARPWLAFKPQTMANWLQSQSGWLADRGWEEQAWVTDPTNADPHFARNKLRATVLPPLLAGFVQAPATFARSAEHCAQAQRLLNELAELDLATSGDPPRLKALQQLSRDRQANALRHWLRSSHGTQANTAQLNELLRQVACATTRGHKIDIKVGGGFVRRAGVGGAVLAWYNP